MKSHARPSYAQGLATPERGGLLHPALWENCIGAWLPSAGATGLTLRDHSGRGNHGAITGATAAEAWASPHGLTFDAADDYVDCGAGGSSDPVHNLPQFTISGWFQTDVVNNYGVVFRRGTYFAGIYLSRVFMQIGGVWTAAGQVVPDTGWHYLTASFDGINQRIYLNAELGETKASAAPSGAASNILLGRHASGNEWDGQLNDIALWSRALPASEIQQLYRLGPGGSYARRRRVLYSNPPDPPTAGRINSLIGVGGGMIGYGGGMIGAS